MRPVRFSFVALLLCFLLAPLASAQFGGPHAGPPSLQGVFQPVVGRGAAYDMQGADGQKTALEIAVVGKDSVNGADGYWIEMSFDGPHGPMIMKSLTAVQTNNVVVSRMIMQIGTRPPMEFPQQFLNRANQPRPADIKSEAEDVGSETITVPAGTFHCEHYRMKDGSNDVWVTQEVSPWGVVKSQGKDSTMVLTKTISDAKDKITGTPVPFNPMMMGGPPSQ
jgi:hypothetical protein